MLSVKDIRQELLFQKDLRDNDITLLVDKNGKRFDVILFDTYGKHDSFGGKIRGLLTRIWNAVKAIIGKSKWQKTRKEFVKNFLGSKAKEELETAITKVGPLFSSKLKKYYDALAICIYTATGKAIIHCSKAKIKSKEQVLIVYDKYWIKETLNEVKKLKKMISKKSLNKTFGKKYTHPQTDKDKDLKKEVKSIIEIFNVVILTANSHCKEE